jgi:Zn-dependent protease with chaperone function
MNFFEQQERAQSATRWMVFFFLLIVAGTSLAIGQIFLLVFKDPSYFWMASLGTVALILLASWWQWYRLSSGGASVALMLGGRLLDRDTVENEAERRYLSIVEEMSIASGCPLPAVFVLDAESGINAFAAGHRLDDAAVAVTRGALQSLSRDELQGVIAHEFSHIAHGDMRLNMRLLGLLHGLLFLSAIGRLLMRAGTRPGSSRGRSKGRGGAEIMGIGLLIFIFGWFSYALGRLLQASISRRREYLADASAVQYTRLPQGIAGALMKIGNSASGSSLITNNADQMRHFFFSSPQITSWFQWLSTHPPLEKRVQALLPNAKVEFPDFAQPASQLSAAAVSASASSLSTQAWSEQMSNHPLITEQGLAASQAWLGTLPASLKAALHDNLDVQALYCALALHHSPKSDVLLDYLTTHKSKKFAHQVSALRTEIAKLPDGSVIDLALLTRGAFQNYSPAQVTDFLAFYHAFVRADQQFSIYDFSLLQILEIMTQHRNPQRKLSQYHSLKALAHEVSVYLSCLAHLSKTKTEAAFASASANFKDVKVTLLGVNQARYYEMRSALEKLSLCSPALKQRLLKAAAEAAAFDGVIQPNEAQMLRVLSLSFGIPSPSL